MLSSTFLVLPALLSFLQIAFAAPDQPPFVRQSIPLFKRQPTQRSTEEWGARAKNEREALRVKYGRSLSLKRSEGESLLINFDSDQVYLGFMAIGTPPAAFNVILDTGSSDLWVLDNHCGTNCSAESAYNSSSSSTFRNLSQPLSIAYGSGEVAGSIVSDIVQMAGFEVKNQIFGAVTQASSALVPSPVSGLLGLGWPSISALNQIPFWQTLASKGAWSQPVMGFHFTRFMNTSNTVDASNALNTSSGRPLEPGGSFTMGFLNSSLYTGNIDYQNLVMALGFWVLPVTKFTAQGSTVSLPSESPSYAAIDTGTTNIGALASIVQGIYAQIPGSQPASGGEWEGYWTYPCDTPVNVAISFGGPSWPISPADFQLAQIGSDQCVGALFEMHHNSNGSALSWIIGAAFLKNVYSVFRYDPPSVGFASLSEAALSMNGVNAPVPSATIGSVAASVTAEISNVTSGALWTSGSTLYPFTVACAAAVGAML